MKAHRVLWKNGLAVLLPLKWSLKSAVALLVQTYWRPRSAVDWG
jgi:hypothetical protein